MAELMPLFVFMILLLSILAMASCSKDDENIDLIIGSWNPYKVVLHDDPSYEMNPCNAETVYVFNDDRSGETHEHVVVDGNCTEVDALYNFT